MTSCGKFGSIFFVVSFYEDVEPLSLSLFLTEIVDFELFPVDEIGAPNFFIALSLNNIQIFSLNVESELSADRFPAFLRIECNSASVYFYKIINFLSLCLSLSLDT